MTHKAFYKHAHNGAQFPRYKLYVPVRCKSCGEYRYVLKQDARKAARRLCQNCLDGDTSCVKTH